VLHDIPALVTGQDRKSRRTVPTLIMAGAHDPVTPPAVLAGGERHADDLRVQVVSDAGQFLPAERPDLVAAAVRRLFAGGGPRDPAAIFGWARAVAVREAVRVARQAARAIPGELTDLPAPGDPLLAADVADVLLTKQLGHSAIDRLADQVRSR
jgi:hypothetical protein